MSKETLNNTLQKKTTHLIKKNLKSLVIVSTFLILTLFSYIFYTDLKKKMK